MHFTKTTEGEKENDNQMIKFSQFELKITSSIDKRYCWLKLEPNQQTQLIII